MYDDNAPFEFADVPAPAAPELFDFIWIDAKCRYNPATREITTSIDHA